MSSLPLNPLENLESRGGNSPEKRELSDEELAQQQEYNQRLNAMMYGDADEYGGVQSSRNRSSYEHADQSETLAVAGEGSSMEVIDQELREMRETAEGYASQLGVASQSDRMRFSDIDTRTADATAYAQARGRIGEQGMLHDNDRIRAEKAAAMEAALKSYIEGRNHDFLSDVDESSRNKIHARMGQLIEHYGDITKASSKELEDLYNQIESVKGTQQEVEESPEVAAADPLEQIKAAKEPSVAAVDEEESQMLALQSARNEVAAAQAAIEAQKRP